MLLVNRGRRILLMTGVVALLGGACSSTSSAAHTSSSPYLVGLVSDETGPASSVFIDTPAAVEARIDLQNAEGGVNGHQIKLVTADAQPSPTANVTATQDLLAKGVLALVQLSTATFAAAKTMQEAGVPVIGGGFDGFEWGEQPNTNMFSFAPVDPKEPVYALPAAIWKSVSPVSALGYGESPSSAQAAKSFAYAAQKFGLKVGYLNDTLPLGTVNTTAISLALKSKGVEGIDMPLDTVTNLAVLTAAEQEGI